MNAWLLLGIGIVAELVGTTCFRLSEGFTKLGPSVLAVVSFALTFWAMSQAMQKLPLALSYAIASGVGAAGMALIGYWIWNEAITPLRVLGLVFIVGGVAILGASGTQS